MAAKTRQKKTSRMVVGLAWGIPGTLIGLGVGWIATVFSEMAGNEPASWTPLVAAVAIGGTAWAMKAFVIEGAGDLAQRIYMGGEEGTSPEYSVAHGLALRGQYEAAVDAFAAGAGEYPEDPEPLLAGARLLRDPLGRFEEARDWLLRARRIPDIGLREEVLVVQELVDLYDGPLEEPARAMPLLAQVKERHAGTRPGEWAARRLAALRTERWETVRRDEADGHTDYQRSVLGRDERDGREEEGTNG